MELWLVYKGLQRVLGDNQREGVCRPHNPPPTPTTTTAQIHVHTHISTHTLTQERNETGASELLSRQKH